MIETTRTCKHSYCKKYGEFAQHLCPNLSSDDYDELVDSCQGCCYRKTIEVEVDEFEVRCIKDFFKYKAGDVTTAYIDGEYPHVGGYISNLEEFKEYFEEV